MQYTQQEQNILKKFPDFFTPINEEEQELKELIESDRLVYGDAKSASQTKKMQDVINHYKEQNERKPISLRPKKSTLNTIRNFAKKSNIGYQTLINNRIDEFAEEIRAMGIK